MPDGKTNMRELALELLDDGFGISMDAWSCLFPLLEESGEEFQDIVDAVETSEGRVYLEEDHGLG